MSREHPLAPHRLIPAAIVLALGLATLLAVKGPDWYQRFYHPLRYEAIIADRARASSLDPYLVAAVINVESDFNASGVSSRGAVGLMQIMPSTAREVARDNRIDASTDPESLRDPGLNIRLGTLHLAALLARFGATEEALAAYNAGAGSASAWRHQAEVSGRPFRDVVQYPETVRYIDDVLGQRDVYERLYPGAFEEPSP